MMETVIARLLKEFEDGKMTRRQLIQSLALAAAAAMPGAAAAAQTAAQTAAQAKAPIPQAFEPTGWKTVWLDHISYAEKVKAELEKRGLEPRPDMVGENFKSWHVTDPDGWDLQISNQTREPRIEKLVNW